jgi:NodT family efflux transporter outer membrane factor (OMF) lipoprotein
MRLRIGGRARIPISLMSVVLSGCSVGPRYVRPQFPTPDSYKEAPAGTEVLQPALPNDAASRRDWWQAFGSVPLSSLEEQLVAGNPSLAEADARFRQAKAVVRQDRAAYAPTIGTSLSADRIHGSSGALNGAAQAGAAQYALTGDVSWEPDFWGRVRKTVAAGVASAQAARGDVENARLSLTATLALDYFQLRSFDADLVLLDENIEAYERSLALTQNQYNAGLVARTDVAQAETQLASARAQAVDVTLQRAQMEHAIAVLIGVAPSALSLQPAPLDGEPPPVPLELPSRLLERRADVAAAERRVAAANAQIGVATSAFFPTVTLTGSVGFQASALVQWLAWPSRFWSLGPTLALTLFDGGARQAARANAQAAYDAEAATYRQVILTGFQDVEDNLAAQRLLADESKQQQAAATAARTALDVSLNQYRAGLVSYLAVVTSQSTSLTAERTVVALTARRYEAAVQLIKALGGGWDGRLDVS